MRKDAETDRERLDRAHLLAFARPARSEEARRGEAFLEKRRAAGMSEEAAWASLARVLLSANEFIYID